MRQIWRQLSEVAWEKVWNCRQSIRRQNQRPRKRQWVVMWNNSKILPWRGVCRLRDFLSRRERKNLWKLFSLTSIKQKIKKKSQTSNFSLGKTKRRNRIARPKTKREICGDKKNVLQYFFSFSPFLFWSLSNFWA